MERTSGIKLSTMQKIMFFINRLVFVSIFFFSMGAYEPRLRIGFLFNPLLQCSKYVCISNLPETEFQLASFIKWTLLTDSLLNSKPWLVHCLCHGLISHKIGYICNLTWTSRSWWVVSPQGGISKIWHRWRCFTERAY